MYVDVTANITGGDRIVDEDAGSVEVCVSLDHAPEVPVSVTVTTTSGMALGESFSSKLTLNSLSVPVRKCMCNQPLADFKYSMVNSLYIASTELFELQLLVTKINPKTHTYCKHD